MKMGHEKSEMQEYYGQLSAFLKNQTEYKVWSISGHQRIRVPIQQVMGSSVIGEAKEQEIVRTVHAAMDAGINLFDLAVGHGNVFSAYGRNKSIFWTIRRNRNDL